ncbi:MAG TPA: ABC transporter permease [Caldimonas sp.]|nr:ABC transporter permease [Caldimonas sp.]HEX2542196.1 ABC transporter permease [Caldimonas sp.]
MRELVIRPRSGWIAIDWRELWDSRELLYFLVLRDVKVRYKQTVLGVAWAVLQPLFAMVIFTVIFGKFAKIPSDGFPYAIFVYAGLMPWTFFSNNISQASQSLLNQQSLLTKIYLPRLFIPASAIGSGLIDLLVSFTVFAGLMLYYGVPIRPGIVVLPLLVLLTAAASLGVGLLLAALIVTYRDFRYVVPFLVQSWLYVSPVIYPVSMVPPEWQALLALNPMAGIIDAFRSALLGSPWNHLTLLISTISSLLLLLYGLFYFRKTERSFADVA